MSKTTNNPDIVYLYPKTSCPCGNCKKEYNISSGPPTNLSVQGCNVSPYFNCYDSVLLSSNEQPCKKQGYEILNPQVYQDQTDPRFQQVGCNTGDGCPQPSYMALDPRLYSVNLANYTPLNQPPMNGDVKLKDLLNEDLDCYGQGFTPYDQIRDGQITYYIDKSIENAYFEPVFSEPAKATKTLYKDPMGAMKMEYNRERLDAYNPTVTTPNCCHNRTCLSYLEDTGSFREDIMAHQMRKRNQERWSPAWTQ